LFNYLKIVTQDHRVEMMVNVNQMVKDMFVIVRKTTTANIANIRNQPKQLIKISERFTTQKS